MAEIKDPENTLVMETTKGKVVIELFPDLAPGHVGRIKELAREGAYDGVVFHRVIDGFMAQTGDVKFGNSTTSSFNPSRAGMGGSDKPDLKAEFNNMNHGRGTCSMGSCADGLHCASGKCACDPSSCSGCCSGDECLPGTATAAKTGPLYPSVLVAYVSAVRVCARKVATGRIQSTLGAVWGAWGRTS